MNFLEKFNYFTALAFLSSRLLSSESSIWTDSLIFEADAMDEMFNGTSKDLVSLAYST